ncbi:MAG: SH3 domain-containing protein [Chloroflexi bacterium]|nr:SH3 domain-containing protein [Chloroflexota bacterium]
MKRKSLLTLALLFLVCVIVSAQGYSIRVVSNTNLRASNSLSASIIETAPAGTILTVLGGVNQWLRIDRNGREVWMASWVRHERVEGGVQTQSQTTSTVDNCCFVDRQCSSDQDWTDGYWAFQNGQCAAPAQTQVSTQPAASTIPAGVDNCCQVNRQCYSDDDWARGFYDFRDNQCQGAAPTTSTAPISGPIPENVDNCCFVNRQCHTEQDYIIGYEQFRYGFCNVANIAGNVNIKGSGFFVGRIKEALNYLLNTSPRWYQYIITGLWTIEEVGDNELGQGLAAWVWAKDRRTILPTRTVHNSIESLVSTLIHEACHVQRHKDGLEAFGLVGERACTEVEIAALHNFLSADHWLIQSNEYTLANIHKTSGQWWHN